MHRRVSIRGRVRPLGRWAVDHRSILSDACLVHLMSRIRPPHFIQLVKNLNRQPITQWAEWLWNQRIDYKAIHFSVTCSSFAHTAHSFAYFALLASWAHSAAPTCLLAHSLTLELMGFCLWNKCVDFIPFLPYVDWSFCFFFCWSFHHVH